MTGWLIRVGFFIGVGWVVGEGRRQLMRMAESRQRFVSAISHELRTPLAGALGFSKLLADQQGELSPEEVREFADLIHREMNQLSDVVDGYLIAARLDDSALIIEPRDVELHRLVTQVMDELPAALRTGRVSVAPHPAVAWADPLRVRQVLRSVLAHCLASGCSHLVITTQGSRRWAKVEFRAEGAELPTEVIDADFTLVAQPTATTNPRPVGLGLAVAYQLTKLMGGHLQVESHQGVVELRLPAGRPAVQSQAS